jgi:hypothetical protein
MGRRGVKRCVSLSTGSVKDPEDRFDLTYSLLVAIIKVMVRSANDEIVRIGEIARSSKTDRL